MEFCPLIPIIGLKVLNSVVKGDLWPFEVPLSYIGPLYNTRNPQLTRINAENFFVAPYA